MSSLLVTFNFKTFPKHRWTQFLNLFAQIWGICNWRQQVSIDFHKKKWKFDFFQFFFKQIISFNRKLNSMWKMLSFDVKHVEMAQKLQNLEFLLIFLHYWLYFQFSPFFSWKKNLKKVSNELKLMPSYMETLFLS